MANLRPVHYRKFERFLVYVGCTFTRQEGDHKVYKRSGLIRPVIVRTKKDLPIIEIKSNLRTLGISTEEYLKIIENI